jgi:hypothetical protein
MPSATKRMMLSATALEKELSFPSKDTATSGTPPGKGSDVWVGAGSEVGGIIGRVDLFACVALTSVGTFCWAFVGGDGVPLEGVVEGVAIT